MKIFDIMDFIIFILVTIFYITTSIILYFVFKNNVGITLFLEGLIIVNLFMWIECNIFIKKIKNKYNTEVKNTK